MHKNLKIPMLEHKKRKRNEVVMTIPSPLLIAEIKHYEEMHTNLYLNALGMPVIGYGYALLQEPQKLVKKHSKLGLALKNILNNDTEHFESLVQKILKLPISITEEKAHTLLEENLLFYADELGKMFKGFRHIVNKCENAYFLPQSICTYYLQKIEEQQKVPKKKNEEQVTPCYFHQRNQAPCYQYQIFFDYPLHVRSNASVRDIAPQYLQNRYSSSAEYQQRAKQKTVVKKQKRKNVLFVPTEAEKALIRVDSILFLTHLLGLEMVKRMPEFFIALLEEEYETAGNYLLAHRSARYFGHTMYIIARRIKYGTIDLLDFISCKQKPQIPKLALTAYSKKIFQAHLGKLNPEILLFHKIQKCRQKEVCHA